MKHILGRNLGSACFVLMALSGVARADLIGLSLLPTPDILAGFIDVTYNAATDTFMASGFSLELDGSAFDAVGTFDIEATIDAAGTLDTGTVAIGGMVAGGGPSLLTGDLTALGFSTTGGDPFEFLFDVTGGDLAGLYGGVGTEVGIILSAGSGFGGSFSSDFDNLMLGMAGTGAGVADVAPVPAPSASILGLIGMGVAGMLRRFTS